MGLLGLVKEEAAKPFGFAANHKPERDRPNINLPLVFEDEDGWRWYRTQRLVGDEWFYGISREDALGMTWPFDEAKNKSLQPS